MARNNVRLINYHTTGTTAPKKSDLKPGEIAVGKDLIWANHNDDEDLSVFIASGTIVNAITAAEKTVTGQVNALDTKVNSFSSSVETNYATVISLNAVSGASSAYTDSQINAIKGAGYTEGTLKSLSDAIDSLKGDSDTTVGAVAKRVTDIEGILGNSESEGLRKEVADLKITVGDSTTGLVKDVADLKSKDSALDKKIDAVSGASSAYTDSQINTIKGAGYTEGTTLASIKSEIGTEKGRIDAILKDAPTNLKSFKDVDDKINTSIASVYRVKGTIATYDELPIENNTVGDVYNVTAANGNTPAGTNYVCVASAGTRVEQWDALGGTIDLSTYATKSYVDTALSDVTGDGTNSLKTRLGQAETNISNLQESATTFDKDIKTIKGWKINDKFVSGSPVLDGTDINVDNSENAKTLKVAIDEAKTAGTNAQSYAEGVSGSVKSLTDVVNNNKSEIDAYTVNNLKISTNPVLTGENVLVGGESEDKTKSLNTTIAEAKAAGTTAQNNLNTLKGSYSGTLETLSKKVDVNEENIATINNTLSTASVRANSAIQKITIKAKADAGVTISEPTGAEGEKTQELDFSAIVIDCGEF